MNWNAVPDDNPDKRYGQVSLEQQARYLPLAYERVIEEWPWAGVANTWYLKRATDAWEQNQQPEAYLPSAGAGFHAPAGLRIHAALYGQAIRLARRRLIDRIHETPFSP